MSSNLLVRPTGPVTEYNAAEPWQRQPCDEDPAWTAFQLWLQAPIPRSIIWVAARCEGMAVATLKYWRDHYGWDGRANAFDNYCHQHFQTRVLAVLEERAQDYTERHLVSLAKAHKLATNELAKFLAASEETPGMGILSAKELITLLDMSIKLERLVRGETTDNVQTQHDLSRLEPVDLLSLKRMQLKAGIK